MPLTITEAVDSRKMKESRRNGVLERTLERRFIIAGSDDTGDAAVLALGPQPQEQYGDGSLNLFVNARDYEVVNAGGTRGVLRLTVSYGPPESLSDSPNQSSEEPEYSLELMSDQAKVERGLEQTHYPADASGVGNMIGVNGDKIDGVDIYVPKISYKETKTVSKLSSAYINAIYNCSACVNERAWKNWAAGEVLFLGATAKRRGRYGVWNLDFSFAIEKNVAQVINTVSGDQNVTKAGWDYLWIEQATKSDDGATVVHIAKAVHVARVYPRADFSTLGLSTRPL